MLYYALAFLLVGLTADALHLAGISTIAVQFSWVLFMIGTVLIVIHVFSKRSMASVT